MVKLKSGPLYVTGVPPMRKVRELRAKDYLGDMTVS